MAGDFPGGGVVKNLPANAGDMRLIPGPEDPTCCRATKPVHHNYWACALEPTSHNYWAHVLQLLKPACSRAHVLQILSLCAATTEAHTPRAPALQQEKSPQWEACALQQRVAPAHHN